MRDSLLMRRNSITHANASFLERFWKKVSKDSDTGCWLWIGATNNQDYGQINLGAPVYRLILAHRASWEIHHGPILDGLTIDHRCRNRKCVNPDHLEPVTHTVNVERGECGIVNRSKTHCPSGHIYDEENTYLYEDRRYCRECNRAYHRKENKVRAQCHPDRPHRGHGLCNPCYLRNKRAGTA